VEVFRAVSLDLSAHQFAHKSIYQRIADLG